MAEVQTGSRRRMRAPERREQLLAVARKVFASGGYQTVTMDDVARQAGVTKPILYDHFPSKRDLYRGLLEHDLAALYEKIRTALGAPKGNRERIRASFQAYFDFVDEEGAGFRLLMKEAVGAEEEFRAMVQEWREQILRDVTKVIERESEGRLDRREAEDVAQALIGMAETVSQYEPGRTKRERRTTVDTLVRLAWRGITGLTP
jgi:AcrR family transcriptional regulator